MTEPRLKTLHIFESYLPESQNWAFRFLNNFDASEVYVCAPAYVNPHFVSPKIHLLPIPNYVSSDLMIEGGGQSDSLYDKAIAKLKRKTRFDKYLDYISKKAKELNIDLIHCHFANVGWEFLKLKKLTELPFIVSFYGFDYESLPHNFTEWEKRYQKLFTTADLFICEGPFGASTLKSKGCSEKKIKINRLGVDLKKIPFFQREKKENELRLVQISNFFQKKGQLYTLQAFIQAAKTCTNLSLTFVGSDFENSKIILEKMAAEHHLEDKITFLDFIDFSQLYDFLKSFHVFIQPSCYADNRDCEGGAPVVILDAEATGMPVIATTHCDIPLEVIHKKTGFLTPEKNSFALTESIVRFYRMTNDEYQRFSADARKHIEDNFDAIKNASSLKDIYMQYLSKFTIGVVALISF
ncbi:MAG: glycosyltransferase family 4 protein [Bacteroidia bacterium]